MLEALLVNTSTEGLRPLGTPPQRSFELITGTLQSRLSERHALLFSEPVSNQFGDRFDWYAPVQGEAVKLADLPEDARESAETELNKLVQEIRDLAAEYLASDQPDDQRLGEALENAVEVPDEGSVYVLQGPDPDSPPQPVLVHWAWVRDAQGAVRGVLRGEDRRATAKAAAAAAALAAQEAAANQDPPQDTATAAPAAPRDTPLVFWWLIWLGWLLLAALIAAILYLTFQACALRLPGLTSYCPAPPAAASPLDRETQALRDQIAAIERQIGIADRACQPAPPPPPPPPPPEPEPAPEPISTPPDEFGNRRDSAGGQLGDLTFTLVWDGPDDLDIHVTCPTGARVYFRTTRACNGRLDVDSNASRITRRPIENIFYNNPTTGRYQVRIHYFKSRTGNQPRPFRLQINDRGRTKEFSGVVSANNRNWSTTYQFGGR